MSVDGPRFLSYQQVYVTATSNREALAAGLAAVDAIEALHDTFAVVGFTLEQYDGVGYEENGHGCSVTLTFDTSGGLTKPEVEAVATRLAAS